MKDTVMTESGGVFELSVKTGGLFVMLDSGETADLSQKDTIALRELLRQWELTPEVPKVSPGDRVRRSTTGDLGTVVLARGLHGYAFAELAVFIDGYLEPVALTSNWEKIAK